VSGPGWWFFIKAGHQETVHGLAALVELARRGAIAPTTFVWRSGMSEWRPAAEVTELMAHLEEDAAQPPPSRPPAPDDALPTPPAPPDATSIVASAMRREGRVQPRFGGPRANAEAPALPREPPAAAAGATEQDLGDAGRGEAHDLSGVDFPEVLQLLHERRASGMLEVRQLDVVKTVTLEQGRIVFAASSDPDERLGELLMRQGRITLAQYIAAGRDIGPDRRLGTVLVEHGAIGPAALVRVVIEQVQEILYGLFQWTAASYRIVETPLSADQEAITLRLSTPDILIEGIRRIGAWSRIDRGIGGPEARYRRAQGWESEARHVKSLPEPGRELLQGFEDGSSVSEICSDARGLSDFEVCRLIWALKAIELLSRQPESS
jgi:hypothetical protein